MNHVILVTIIDTNVTLNILCVLPWQPTKDL